jgi:anti-sigma-K factor RskA
MEPCLHSTIRLREVYRENFSFELTSPDQSWKAALSFRSTCVVADIVVVITIIIIIIRG